ncbi:S100P-binding protein [Porphyrio hochstetteri]
MDAHSHQAIGLCHEFKPTAHTTTPRAKRLLDSTEKVQAVESAKKAFMLSDLCSTPDSSKELPFCLDSSCFQESSCCLGDVCHSDLAASSAASNYDDLAISLDTTRCFDSEPDGSLLELSGSEEGNSPFNYTEEEIQEILADDCVESEQYLTRKSTLSQNGNGKSEKEEESSTSSGPSVTSDDATITSEIAETPKELLSRECSPAGSECHPSLSNGSASLDETPLQAQATCLLFNLDIQELLSLSPISVHCVGQPLDNSCLAGAEREASEATRNDCLEYDKTAGSSVPEESLEGLMSNSQQSLGEDCLGNTAFASRDVSHFCGDHVERSSMPSSSLACDQSTADESSAPVLPRCPTLSSESRNQELSKATKSCFSRNLDSPDDDLGQEYPETEQPANSIKENLSNTAVGQMGQKETSRRNKPGEVVPVPQEEERWQQQSSAGRCAEMLLLLSVQWFFPADLPRSDVLRVAVPSVALGNREKLQLAAGPWLGCKISDVGALE